MAALLKPSVDNPWFIAEEPFLWPRTEPGPGLSLIDPASGCCHWRENLFFVGPGVARYVRPAVSFWGQFDGEDIFAMLASAEIFGLMFGSGLKIPARSMVLARGVNGATSYVQFVDEWTWRELRDECRWPPPEMRPPNPSWQPVSRRRSEEGDVLTTRELRAILLKESGPRQDDARLRFDREGGFRMHFARGGTQVDVRKTLEVSCGE